MATPHNEASKGDFAKTVLMPGDPLRAKYVAENFLEDVKRVNTVRNAFGYTGTYKGVPVSIMTSGMGMPSIGIYSYELYTQYDVENIIRIGSAGCYVPEFNVLDVTMAEYAYSESTFAKYTSGCDDTIMYPSKKINEMIQKKAAELSITCKPSKVHSTDQFYTTGQYSNWEDVRDRTRCDVVEMESFALFHNANILGKNAACLLTISDSFVTSVEIPAEERQTSFKEMMKLALETAIAL